MVTMKRTLVTVATVFAVASTSAVAEGVKMSDQQLDQITAARALSAVVINNPGNAKVARGLDLENGHATCINCFPNEGGTGTGGAVVVVNRKFPDANPLIRCIGSGLQGFC